MCFVIMRSGFWVWKSDSFYIAFFSGKLFATAVHITIYEQMIGGGRKWP
jgi:hypothetical protein